MVIECKVSVILPVLNAIQYIDECVRSILTQTLKDIEVLCIDAGSTDGTVERFQYYASVDSRVRIIHSEQKSYGYQVNLGLQAAKGKYFAIVDSDDYIRENMYEKLFDLAESYELDAVKCDFCQFYGEGLKRTFIHIPLIDDNSYYGRVMSPVADTDLFRSYVLNQCGIYSLDFIRKHDIRLVETPGASYQDCGLWFMIFAYSERMLFCDQTFYMLRRDNPKSSIYSKTKVFCICDVFDYIRNEIKQTKNPVFIEKYLPICARYRFSNYEYSYDRVGEEYKLSFLYKFSFDFDKLTQTGELKKSYFTEQQWDKLMAIKDDPFRYYCTSTYGKTPHLQPTHVGGTEEQQFYLTNLRAEAYQTEMEAIRKSTSYRIGRFVTFVPRLMRGMILCCREHGVKYTLHRILVHLHLKADEHTYHHNDS